MDLKLEWVNNFVTGNEEDGYTAWDETQAYELGTFETKNQAVIMVLKHADELYHIG
ncbi:MAG: hypothetical protein WC055_00830 [Melioribacteraceae bacterium]